MKYLRILILIFVVGWTAGCGSSNNDNNENPVVPVQNTIEGSSFFTLQGFISESMGFNYFSPVGYEGMMLFISNKELTSKNPGFLFSSTTLNRLDQLDVTPPETGWVESTPIYEKRVYWARCLLNGTYKFIRLRVASIIDNNVSIEYILGPTVELPKTNLNANDVSVSQWVTDLSIPSLKKTNQFIAHRVTANGSEILNYALEWDKEYNHANWVAYSFNSFTVQSNVKRTDAWDADPEIEGMTFENFDYLHKSDGFDRGHLVASADRLYSVDANKQTFYYSNISPMLPTFNGGFWSVLEGKVRNCVKQGLATNFDEVYLTKGGTLNELLVKFQGTVKSNDGKYPVTDENGLTVKGLPVPKYYYIALLAKSKDTYQAIGFLVEHKETLPSEPSLSELQKYAVSIDELEKATGIDFFCNLRDDIETNVEGSFDFTAWKW